MLWVNDTKWSFRNNDNHWLLLITFPFSVNVDYIFIEILIRIKVLLVTTMVDADLGEIWYYFWQSGNIYGGGNQENNTANRLANDGHSSLSIVAIDSYGKSTY